MAALDLGKVAGSRIYEVTGAPGTELGLPDDWAIDPASGDVYKRTDAGWTKQGNFTGPQGVKGDTGAPGADGKTPTLSIDGNGHLIASYE